MTILAKHVLVTGGAGFLGSHLCESLLQHGREVLCVDNLVTGSTNNIEDYYANPKFKFIKHDVTLPYDWTHGIDEVFNLACPASPAQYHRNPVQIFKTCIFGAANMLELCKEQGARLLQVSTGSIYGDPAVHPQVESYVGNVNPIGERACYEEGKRAAETLCYDYYRQYGLTVKIARLFNVYGPRMQLNDGRVIPNFILQALKNKPLTIFGDGMQTRSFCYVSDVIQGLLRLLDREHELIGPLNIGNTQEVTILELAQLIIKLTGSRSSLIYIPKEEAALRRRPDIQLARSSIGWVPVTPLSDGLERTITYFDALLSADEETQSIAI